MPAKQLMFGEAAHAKIIMGMNTLAEAVRVTLRPKARTVVLERPYGPPTMINSGVIVAREIELKDRFENMGAQMVREVAAKTSEVAGDRTTTAMVLAAGIVSEGMKYVAAGMNPMDLKRSIELAVEALVAILQTLARPCATPAEIAQVASISTNNDRSIDENVAAAIAKVGNAGEEPSVVLQKVIDGKGTFGYNAATGEYGDLVQMGVLDPCKVTRTALRNAGSIAGLILTADCMIAQAAA